MVDIRNLSRIARRYADELLSKSLSDPGRDTILEGAAQALREMADEIERLRRVEVMCLTEHAATEIGSRRS